MLRVQRFAAAIDMIAAGTSAPMTMAAYATPANHDGNSFSNSCGTACCGLVTFTPAAIATKPSRASSPSRKEYAGSSEALRRITERLRVDRTPVIECGYMNNASADPNARVQYAWWSGSGGIVAFGAAAPDAIASAFWVSKSPNDLVTVSKMWPHPPIWWGM